MLFLESRNLTSNHLPWPSSRRIPLWIIFRFKLKCLWYVWTSNFEFKWTIEKVQLKIFGNKKLFQSTNAHQNLPGFKLEFLVQQMKLSGRAYLESIIWKASFAFEVQPWISLVKLLVDLLKSRLFTKNSLERWNFVNRLLWWTLFEFFFNPESGISDQSRNIDASMNNLCE